MRNIRTCTRNLMKRFFILLSFGFILLTKREHWNPDIKEKAIKCSVMTLEINVLVHVLLGTEI